MNLTHILYSFLAIVNEMSPFILLGFFIAGLLHVFVSDRVMSRHLSGPGWKPVVKAALFGIPLPLCSCGVLPAAVSLRRNGASRGAVTSFLIATPQTGVDSIAATYSLLGLPFAIIRPVAALVGSVVGGWSVSRALPEKVKDCGSACDVAVPAEEPREGFFRRLGEALRYGFVDMVSSVGKWLVIGLVVAALITVFVPDSLFVSLSRYPLLAMLVVVAVAVPMYICATGSIPIALSLMMKGLSPGIAFVLLMAGPAANFASIIILSRVQGRKATAIYVASVVVTAIAFGLLIDLMLPSGWFVPRAGAAVMSDACHTQFGIFESICSAVLVLLLVYAAISGRGHNHSHNINNEDMNTKTYIVKGMACAHCKATVEKSLSALPGVESVEVNLADGTATVHGDASADSVLNAISLAGFEGSTEK